MASHLPPIDPCALFRRYVPRTLVEAKESCQKLSDESCIVPFTDSLQQLRCLHCGWWSTNPRIPRYLNCEMCKHVLLLPHQLYRHRRWAYLESSQNIRMVLKHVEYVVIPDLAQIITDYLTWCPPQVHDLIMFRQHIDNWPVPALVCDRKEIKDAVSIDSRGRSGPKYELLVQKYFRRVWDPMDDGKEWVAEDSWKIDTHAYAINGFAHEPPSGIHILMNPNTRGQSVVKWLKNYATTLQRNMENRLTSLNPFVFYTSWYDGIDYQPAHGFEDVPDVSKWAETVKDWPPLECAGHTISPEEFRAVWCKTDTRKKPIDQFYALCPFTEEEYVSTRVLYFQHALKKHPQFVSLLDFAEFAQGMMTIMLMRRVLAYRLAQSMTR